MLCITANFSARLPRWVRLCRAASLESAAAVPPRTDTPCAETPYEAADIWRAERTHSARLASNVGLLGDGQSVIDLDTEIANRALDLGVTEQQLDGPQIAGAAIDQRSLGPPQ